MRFSFTSVRAKLFSAFGLTLALLVAVGVVGIFEIKSVAANGTYIATNSLPSIDDIREIEAAAM